MLSQRTVGKLQVLLQVLFRRPPQTFQLLSQMEYKRRLYEADIPARILEHIEDRYDWQPSAFLPALYDGRALAFFANEGYGEPEPGEGEQEIGRALLLIFTQVALEHGLTLPNHLAAVIAIAKEVLASLQLDGFDYVGGKVVPAALRGVDLQEEHEYLLRLLHDIKPPNIGLIAHHYKEADDTYSSGKWGSSSNETRNFFIAVLRGLRDVATAHGAPVLNQPVSDKNLIEDYERIGFLTVEEKEAVLKLWVLLSYSGSHPGIQDTDRARLTRLLVLGLTEWLCLKTAAYAKQGSP